VQAVFSDVVLARILATLPDTFLALFACPPRLLAAASTPGHFYLCSVLLDHGMGARRKVASTVPQIGVAIPLGFSDNHYPASSGSNCALPRVAGGHLLKFALHRVWPPDHRLVFHIRSWSQKTILRLPVDHENFVIHLLAKTSIYKKTSSKFLLCIIATCTHLFG
jgi:hypothetical protein